jgi:hypothetical protein
MNATGIIESHPPIHLVGWVLIYFVPQGAAVAVALIRRRSRKPARYSG